MKPKYYAQGTMNTNDGQILGTVRYNPAQRKWQSNVDGELSGEFKTKEEAVDDLERAGVKNIKINKDYVMEGKNKPTKRDIMIVEHFVKKTTKTMMNEDSSEPKWDTIHNVFVKFLQANIKILNGFVQSKDYEKTKKGVEGIISGLTNAKNSLLK